MSYSYDAQRQNLFTEGGQRLFLEIRDNAKRILAQAGAIRMDKMMAGCTGDSWDMLACADRMVELGELREITTQGYVVGQHRVFVAGNGC